MNTTQLLLAISTVFLVFTIGAAFGLSYWLLRGNMVSAAEWLVGWIIVPASGLLFVLILTALFTL